MPCARCDHPAMLCTSAICPFATGSTCPTVGCDYPAGTACTMPGCPGRKFSHHPRGDGAKPLGTFSPVSDRSFHEARNA